MFTRDSKLSPLSLCVYIQGEVVDTYVYQGLKVESLVAVYPFRFEFVVNLRTFDIHYSERNIELI